MKRRDYEREIDNTSKPTEKIRLLRAWQAEIISDAHKQHWKVFKGNEEIK